MAKISVIISVYIDKLIVRGIGEYSGQKRILVDVKN